MLREVSRSARRRNGNWARPIIIRLSYLSQPSASDRFPGSLIGQGVLPAECISGLQLGLIASSEGRNDSCTLDILPLQVHVL